MRIIRYLIAILAFAGAATAAANAATVTIDFGSTINLFFSPGESYSEDGFTFNVISGDEFAILCDWDSCDSLLIIGADNAVTIGDTISITADSGGLFTFDALDYASFVDGLSSDSVNLVGLVNGVVVATFCGLSSSSNAFTELLDPLFGVLIDELQIVGAAPGLISMDLDNFVFSEVPLPAAVWMFLAGLGGLGFARKHRAQ